MYFQCFFVQECARGGARGQVHPSVDQLSAGPEETSERFT